MATKLKSGYSWKFVGGKMQQVKNSVAAAPGLKGSTGAAVASNSNASKSKAAANARGVTKMNADKSTTRARTSANQSAKVKAAKPSLRTKAAGLAGSVVGATKRAASSATVSAKAIGGRSSAQVSAAKENILKAIKASAAARKGKKISTSYSRGTSVRSGIRNAVITARGASRFAGRGRR